MREIIWVEEDLKKELEVINDVHILTSEKKDEIIVKLKDNIRYYSEDISSSVLELKALALSTRETYKNVVDEEVKAMEKLWEELDTKRYEVAKKLKETKKIIGETKEDIRSVSKELNELSIYGTSQLLEAVEKVARMSDYEKSLLEKLLSR